MNIRKIATSFILGTIAATATVSAADAQQLQQRPRVQAPQTPDRPMEVCFFTEVGFKQSHFCVTDEKRIAFVEDVWKDRIESITVKNASVKICNEPKMRGECIYVGTDRKELPEGLFDQVYSFKVK